MEEQENVNFSRGMWLHEERLLDAEDYEVQSECNVELSYQSPTATETSATEGYEEDQEPQVNEVGGRKGEYEKDDEHQNPAECEGNGSQEGPQTDQDVTNEHSELSHTEEEEREADEEAGAESILKYARFHGLTTDYSGAQTAISLPDPPASLSSDHEDPTNAALFEVPRTFTTREAWAVDKDAARLLKSVIVLAGDLEVDDVQQPDVYRMRDLKVEMPILRSDHELDIIEFRRKADRDMCIIPLHLEMVDEEDDEGFDWPTKYKTLPAQFDARARSEKLEITKEQLRYLQSMLADTFTAEDRDVMANEELRYFKNFHLEPVTPPLLPLSPPIIPIQLSPIGQLEPLSDGTSPTREEARLLDEQLMKADAIVPRQKRKAPNHDPMLFDETELGYYYSPLASVGRSPSLSPLKRVRIAELKVEGPLTPRTSVEVSGKQRKVTFAEDLEEVIPNWPPLWDKPESAPNSEDYIDGFFNETVAPIAKRAELHVQHEKLQEADSTMRVDVPNMDFSVPDAPWNKAARRQVATTNGRPSQLNYLDGSQKELKRTVWSGISRIERDLPWSPFPLELGRAAIDEHIVDDGSLIQLVQAIDLDDVVHSYSLTWKPEGLRVLDTSDEDEDELEPATFEKKTDMLALLRKRKLQLDHEQEAALPGAVGGPKHLQNEQPARSQNQQTTGTRQVSIVPGDRPKTEMHNGLMFGGLFSASEALTKFMDTQGRTTKKHKQDQSIDLPVARVLQLDRAINRRPPPRSFPCNDVQEQGISNPQPAQPLFVPILPENLPPRTFIFSSSLFTHRRLMRHIHLLFPAASIIERDFTARAGLLTSPSSVVKRRERSSGPMEAEEADLLLSPSTGLILTNLQKIQQRSLPGQAMRNPVKERIQRVALRYERLIVFVSEGRPAPAPPNTILDHFSPARQLSIPNPVQTLHDRECEALNHLTSFSATLDTDITVTYVPGGEEDVAKWVVAAMHRYGVDSAKTNLLQDETLWEIWLRAAGMNAFAAQIVLSELKAPEGQSAAERVMRGESSQSGFTSVQSLSAPKALEYGLPAFVLMGGDERIRRYEALLGGPRVLRRVSQVIDRQWEGLVTGFASRGVDR